MCFIKCFVTCSFCWKMESINVSIWILLSVSESSIKIKPRGCYEISHNYYPSQKDFISLAFLSNASQYRKNFNIKFLLPLNFRNNWITENILRNKIVCSINKCSSSFKKIKVVKQKFYYISFQYHSRYKPHGELWNGIAYL